MKKRKNLKLFFKSAAISLFCFGLLFYVVAGIIYADNVTSRTMGIPVHNMVEYDSGTKAFTVRLFGMEWQLQF